MRNNLKSPLYFYLETKLRTTKIPYLGGVGAVTELKTILEAAIATCCKENYKTHNIFLKESLFILKQYELPKDRRKLQFIIDRLLNPIINCC